jgi:prepilin-type N-terminal cleavage/methylation domain-containing protein
MKLNPGSDQARFWQGICDRPVAGLKKDPEIERRGIRDQMRKQKGFSLIELLIVVAIILIIAAIAIPNLLRSRIAANEASAAASVRTVVSMETQYKINTQSYGTLAQLNTANLIDGALGVTGKKSGYDFASAAVTADTFQVTAVPTSPTNSGNRAFCSDQNTIVKVDGTSNPPVAGTGAACLAGNNALN